MEGGGGLSIQHHEYARHATRDRASRKPRGTFGYRVESVFLLLALTAVLSFVILQTR